MSGQDPSFTVHLVDDAAEASEALAALGVAAVVGVDVERADADRYHREAAVVQVGVAGCCVLLDGLALDDLDALATFLADGPRVCVLHACENDLEPLAAKGVAPTQPEDTAVAASVLGLPTGLRPLLEEVLGLTLDGDKSALQRADWSSRPLTAEMKAYAASDVVHLPALWEELTARLEASGRSSWYEQERDAAIERAGNNARHWTRVKGSGRLSPRQRARLRAVWEAREHLARTHDIAPNRLLHDEVLRALATDPPGTEAELVRRSQRRRALLRRFAPELLAALVAAEDAPEEPREASGRRWTDRDRARYDALRRRRSEIAEELGIDPGVLCPSRPLWAAVIGEPRDGAQLCELAGLRPWQAALLAAPLWEIYDAADVAEAAPQEPGPAPTAEPPPAPAAG